MVVIDIASIFSTTSLFPMCITGLNIDMGDDFQSHQALRPPLAHSVL
jgi:hypothetical protein